MKILVVCGAGASSTFVAQRLRHAATNSGLECDASAGMEHSVAGSDHDLILVGPHLGDRLESIRAHAHSPVVVLPEDVFDDRDGTRTLALVRSVLADLRNSPKGTS